MPVLRVLGNYELVEQIAEGGMGTVYKARRRDTGECVAIKLSPPHLAKNPIMLRRFEQEYNAAKELCHPNLVRALDYGYDGICPYLVMEFVDGESLGQRLERDGKLPEQEAVRIITQVAQGLQKAHRSGLIHRDVKPDNILMNSQGQAKLTDMGLVKEVEADLNLTRTGRGLGTPHFMSPEQFRDAKNVDARSDIYSLAATLYQLVTGELPFGSCSPVDAYMKKMSNELIPPRTLTPAISERIDWAIRRAMNGDRNQRPRNCREFIEDLTGRSTRELTPLENDTSTEHDLWYVVFKDEEGVVHTAKGTVCALRRALKEGRMGDVQTVRASQSKLGPFEFLRSHPEFRDLVFEPPVPSPTPFTRSKAVRQAAPPRETATDSSDEALYLSPAGKDARHQPVTVPRPADKKASLASPNVATPASVSETPAPVPTGRARAVVGPHINMGGADEGNDWRSLLALLMLAVAAGAVGYFILPLLP